MILVVGFIAVFGAMFTEIAFRPPVWVPLVVWIPAAGVLSLALLRPMKGLMIAAHVRNKASQHRPRRHPVRRLPIGLTVAAAIGVAVLVGLGLWQIKRLAWKTGPAGQVSPPCSTPRHGRHRAHSWRA